MKIIGEGEGGKYICEINSTEIANILGYDYANAHDCPSFGIGAVIQIATLYRRVKMALEVQVALRNSIVPLRSAIETIETVAHRDIVIQPPGADGIRRVIKTSAAFMPEAPSVPEEECDFTTNLGME